MRKVSLLMKFWLCLSVWQLNKQKSNFSVRRMDFAQTVKLSMESRGDHARVYAPSLVCQEFERKLLLLHGLKRATGKEVVGVVELRHIYAIMYLWDKYEAKVRPIVDRLKDESGDGFMEASMLRLDFLRDEVMSAQEEGEAKEAEKAKEEGQQKETPKEGEPKEEKGGGQEEQGKDKTSEGENDKKGKEEVEQKEKEQEKAKEGEDKKQ